MLNTTDLKTRMDFITNAFNKAVTDIGIHKTFLSIVI